MAFRATALPSPGFDFEATAGGWSHTGGIYRLDSLSWLEALQFIPGWTHLCGSKPYKFFLFHSSE